MNEQNIEKKPLVDYPCSWLYKLIGKDEKLIGNAVKEIVEEKYTLSKSKNTKKYVSFNLEVKVISEEHRNNYYKKFNEHTSIKMVL